MIALQDVDATPAFETLQRGSRLVSRKVGLIRSLSSSLRFSQDPKLFTVGVSLPDVSSWLGRSFKLQGGGGARTLEVALAAAMGEAVERYSMLFYSRNEMVTACFRDLGHRAVAPEELRLHSAEQVAAEPDRLDDFDESSQLAWVEGFSLTHRRARFVPAALVYQGFRPAPGEARIGNNGSSGLAAAASREEAILSALYECIERDAFTLSWLWRRCGRKLQIDDQALTTFLDRQFQWCHPKVKLTFHELTLDVPIPVILALLSRPIEGGPVLCIGASARLDPREAAWKAVLEAGQSVPYLRSLRQSEPGWKPAPDYADVDSFERHVLCYLRQPELLSPALSFFEDCKAEAKLSDLPICSTGRVLSDLHACVELLAGLGSEVIAVDITPPDVREVGLHVVRVVTTRLMPLHGQHRSPFLGVRRLWELPLRWGWSLLSRDQLNPFPHPFP